MNIRHLTLSVLLVSCQTLPPIEKSESKDAVANVIEEEALNKPVENAEPEKTPHEIENLTIGEVIRLEEPNTQNLYDNSRYDFPITINGRVEGWIDYFTGRGREHMERYLGRSSRYIPVMRQIFKQEGLPEDLVFLALIESGFNVRANSRARAVGPWQFVKGTGMRYGLRVDAWVDERRDPLRSTVAAAKYLKDLYLMFESWYLAASAYNAGEYKILRAIENLKTNNYWRICETHQIRRETKDYVPKLIAAAIIAKNADKYGFDEVEYLEPLQFDTVTVGFPVGLSQLASVVKVPEDEIMDLNPELRRGQVPPGVTSYELRVPPGSRVLVERSLNNMQVSAPKSTAQYIVQPGDSLNSIGRRYRISVRELASVNNLSPKERLAPGLALILSRKDGGSKMASSQRPSQSSTEGGFFNHIVQKGDSLWSISEQYNVTVHDLFRWNDLKRSRIFPGKAIRVRSPRDSGALKPKNGRLSRG